MTNNENPFIEIIEKGLDHSISKWDHYLPIYHKHFKSYREKASPNNKVIILEIGVQSGGSLDMWNKYFGKENCEIYGIDVLEECKKLEKENIHIFIGDQGNIDFLKELINLVPRPHILIDDGGHFPIQQIRTFDNLFQHVRDGGIFLCEDTHTSYMPTYHGGINGPYTFIQHTKNIIDRIHAYHHPAQDKKIDYLTRKCYGIYIYDSMVFFEKSLNDIEEPQSHIWHPK